MFDKFQRFLKEVFAGLQARPAAPKNPRPQRRATPMVSQPDPLTPTAAPKFWVRERPLESVVVIPKLRGTALSWNWRKSFLHPVQTEGGEVADLVRCLLLGWSPQELQVFGSLSLSRTRVRKLPPRMIVHGDLDLGQCHRLKSLGEGLLVGGNLRIGGTLENRPEDLPEGLRLCVDRHVPVASLPERLLVGENLELRDCTELEKLPNKFYVGKSVILRGCNMLQSLPAHWQVSGNLQICGCRALTQLPPGLRVDGDLCLMSAAIQSLPADLRLGGSLLLVDCAKLHELPAGLAVPGNLTIHRGALRGLPHGLQVGKSVRVHRAAEFSELPSDVWIPGNLELLACLSFERFPARVRLGGSLSFRGCAALRELPQGLRVPRSLDLSHCSALTALPAGLHVGFPGERPRSLREARILRLTNCYGLSTLPADLAAETVELAGSGVKDLPAELEKRLLVVWRGVQVPAEVVFHPERLDPAQILREHNAELRRVMMERVGTEEILRRVDARLVDRDTDPGGERRLIELPSRVIAITAEVGETRPFIPQRAASTFRFLVCRCPSTARQYIVRVPPTTETCRQAAAWLAGFDRLDAYHPIRET
ncbi:MAG: DUF6745 domain-containing protein [Thermoguttaceae bacterium]